MQRAASLFLILALGLPARAAETKPKLGVVVVVDQMRADYMERSAENGLGRFLKEGAYFENARHGHVPTTTAAGHSTIATGRHPKDHGIIGNEFYDRDSGKIVYCVDDDRYGKAPTRMTAPALGDRLKAVSKNSKVVSVSAKDRAAVTMGGRRPDLAMWYDKKTGRFTTSAYYGTLPAWAVAWNDENEVSKARRGSIRYHPHIDQMTLSLARRAIEAMDLGEDDVPDLLMVSLSATDYIGHKVGPYHADLNDQLKRLDREIGSFLDYLDRKTGFGAYTAVLTADHGVLPDPDSPQGKAMGAKRVSWKGLEAELEAELKKQFGTAPGERGWVLGWNPPHATLDLKGAENPSVLLAAASRFLTAHDAVVWAYPAARIPPNAPYAEVFERSLPPGRAGDVVFLLKSGILLSDYPSGTSHLLPYDYDARVPLAMLGAGVKAGRYGREVLTVEIAPTLGKLLGAPLDGDVLEEALAR